MSCSSESPKSITPALFNTRSEAEKAAKDFNCKGADFIGRFDVDVRHRLWR